jgi:hypothetical protein
MKPSEEFVNAALLSNNAKPSIAVLTNIIANAAA